jgi:lipopolysaccharide/colanic/teichoic acid biosynthesis glycosyltransferase
MPVQPSTLRFENWSRRGSKTHKSVSGLPGSIKRIMDVVVSAVALLCLAPLLGLIALAVRFADGGSILYRQTRVGLGGRQFTIIKFRTMHEQAESGLGATWSVPNDPRCSVLGPYLRRSGLDELPQLWNILRGDMSLVGPRPERPEFTREFRKQHSNYDVRQTVPAGLTGYAQIHGWRGYTSLEERLRHDLYYVGNWSLRLDLYILFMTVVRGCSERTRSGI